MDGIGSQAPLLSPTSSSDGDDEEEVPLYGSSSRETRAVHSTRPDDDETGAVIQGGIQQADAINLVWTKPTLVLAYSLWAIFSQVGRPSLTNAQHILMFICKGDAVADYV